MAQIIDGGGTKPPSLPPLPSGPTVPPITPPKPPPVPKPPPLVPVRNPAQAARNAALAASYKKQAARNAMWTSVRAHAHTLLQPNGIMRAAAVRATDGRSDVAPTPFSLLTAGNIFGAAAKQAIIHATSTPGDPSSGKALEQLTALAAKNQKDSNGTIFSKPLIDYIDKAYEAHVLKVANDYKKSINTLIAEKLIDKNGKLVGANTGDTRARLAAIWKSPSFQKTNAEYTRLFGSGTKQGTVASWQTIREGLAVAQRKYLYEAAKSTVFRQLDLRGRGDGGGLDRSSDTSLALNSVKYGGQFDDLAKAEIDPAKTSMKLVWDPSARVFVQVARTVNEEFVFRKQQYLSEMNRQYQAYQQAQTLQKIQQEAAARHMDSASNGIAASDTELLANAMRSTGLNDVKTPEKIQLVVKTAMTAWEDKYKRMFMPQSVIDEINSNGSRAGRLLVSPMYKKYLQARDEATSRLYATFGASTPGAIDTVMSFGPIKTGMNLLGGPVSATLAMYRVILKGVTGNSRTFDIQLADLPQSVKDNLGVGGPVAGFMDLAASIPGMGPGAAKQVILNQWLSSPEGMAWYKAEALKHGVLSQEQDTAFSKAMYGNTGSVFDSGGDFWSRLDALNVYGSTISNSPVKNLAAGMLFDPTNLIPLKFTTWLERARYATMVTEDVNGLKKIGLGIKNWTFVDETTLRFEKQIRSVAKDVFQGVDPHLIRERILTSLTGINPKNSMDEQISHVFRELGLAPRLKSDRQLMSVVEEMITHHIKTSDIPYHTVAQGAADAVKAHEIQLVADKAARSERLVESDRALAAMETRAKAGSIAARGRTTERLIAEAQVISDKVAAGVLPSAEGIKGPTIAERLTAKLGSIGKNQYYAKDLGKASKANKFIGEGASGSSTAAYAKALGSDTKFVASDTVFVSANGTRSGRIPVIVQGELTPQYHAVADAMSARSTIITDIPADRVRTFNLGERELASYLSSHGYHEVSAGKWVPLPTESEFRASLRALEDAGGKVIPGNEVEHTRLQKFWEQVRTQYPERRPRVSMDEMRAAEAAKTRSRGDWANEWRNSGEVAAKSSLSDPVRLVTDAAARLTADTAKLVELRAANLTVSDSKLAFGMKSIASARKGDSSALALIARIPSEVRTHAGLVLSIQKSREDALLGLSRIVHLTVGVGVLSEADAKVVTDLVTALRQVPETQGILTELARVQGTDLWASRLGDYLRHEKYFAKAGGAVPSIAELQTVRVTSAQEALRILSGGMTEEQWLRQEISKGQRALARNTSRLGRKAAFRRMRDAQRALQVIEVTKNGGTYISFTSRQKYIDRTMSVIGERAKSVLNPNHIAPYATEGRGAVIEQGRAEYVALQSAPVDPLLGKVDMAGDVSVAYATHHVALDDAFNRPLDKSLLRQIGIPNGGFEGLSTLDILSNIDEFSRSMSNPRFAGFVKRAEERMATVARRITGDPAYSFEQYMSDYLMSAGEYKSAAFEADQKGMSAAIADARGWRSNTLTKLKQRPQKFLGDPVAETLDRDIIVVLAKAKYAKEHGILLPHYNEARRVLRWPLVRKNTNLSLIAQSTERAVGELTAAGLTVESKNWDSEWRKAYDTAYLETRQALTEAESMKQAATLASEMFGSSSDTVIREFEARYALDGTVKGFEPAPITLFQKRTLEDAVRTHLGIGDLANKDELVAGLSKHGQIPPFENRGAMREWLTKYGFWSPRTADTIEAGKKSWSLQEQHDYFLSRWGQAPDWANPELLKDGAAVLPKYGVSLELMKHDESFYDEMMRHWGVFNRNMESRFSTTKLTREQKVRQLAFGDSLLGIKPKRDLELERRYIIEYYGDLASETRDGQPFLTSFPWLMNRDELRSYVIMRGKGAVSERYFQSVDEINTFERLVESQIGQHFDKAMMTGATVTYVDVMTLAANITHEILKDPVWLKRPRDRFGTFLEKQAEFRRALVFTQIGFGTTNVIDTTIKGPWTAFITRSFRVGTTSAYADGLELIHFGLGRVTQLLTDAKPRGSERMLTSAHMDLGGAWQAAIGLSELPAQAASAAENYTKLRLAREMYDGVYERALARLGDSGVADAFARDFAGKEVNRLWPTSGDGPIERLFNQISPFASYNLKNKLVFISEALAHPAIFNYLDKIGTYVEVENRKRWAIEHPNEILPDNLARLIELPWAPGTFLDLGTFSDASRGFSPIYKIAKGGMSVRDFIAQWVRVVGPNEQNFVGGIFNAVGYSSRFGWVPVKDAQGYPTGEFTRVEVPWDAPWGAVANSQNSLWPWELWNSFQKVAGSGLSAQEATILIAQAGFFGGVRAYDRGAGLNAYYWALKGKNSDAAAVFLASADGTALQAWWLDKVSSVAVGFVPMAVQQILNPGRVDPNPWFHSMSSEFQAKVKNDLEALKVLGVKWDKAIFGLTPGTQQYKDAKLMASSERYVFYSTHPEMYQFEAFNKTPSEWATTLDHWKTDQLVEAYYKMVAPVRGDFPTALAWQQATYTWQQQRLTYLKTFPQVAEQMATARSSIESVWTKMEQGWFTTLDKIGTRSIAIEAAKQAHDFALVDQLYLANELDYATLNQDVLVNYFTADDYQTLPGASSPSLVSGLVSHVMALPDFTKWRFDRMNVADKAKFARDTTYATGMKGIVTQAKASGNFGATFVRLLKQNPTLQAEYFRRNPGKREQWATTDHYISLISHFGILAKAGKFDAAHAYFQTLPDWVKARYFAKHPEKRAKIAQNLHYRSLMGQWVTFYKHRDYAGGAAFFAKLPTWAKDRYYAKHPQSTSLGKGHSPYSQAMGKWVKLLQSGKKTEAMSYFNSMPKVYQDRYYSTHPQQKIRNDIKHSGQLGQYFAADDGNRAIYLHENPQFAKWLAKTDTSASVHAMLIMAAYQALPKDDAWLKRVFREKFPSVFSAQSKGDAALKKVYKTLVAHPDMLPSYEKWLAAVMESHAEDSKHTKQPPRMLGIDRTAQRQHGLKRATPHFGKSAAWVRIHSIS